MKNIPKKDLFKTPEGYFKHLGEEILEKRQKSKQRWLYTKVAAAAVLVVSISLAIFKFESSPSSSPLTNSLTVDQQVELLIDQGDWSVEDVLSLSENPNDILDQLLEEQWEPYQLNETELEEGLWNY